MEVSSWSISLPLYKLESALQPFEWGLFHFEVLWKQGSVPHAFSPVSSQEIKTERLEVQRWILSQILRLSSGNGLVISTKVFAFEADVFVALLLQS